MEVDLSSSIPWSPSISFISWALWVIMFYLIDKPAWISSFDVIRKLRKILSIKKMWHVGTLDPFATGCLLIATWKSTKLIPLLESSKKEYIATIRFDGKTDSYDTETPVEKVSTDSFSWKSNSEIEAFLLSQKKTNSSEIQRYPYSRKKIIWTRKKRKRLCSGRTKYRGIQCRSYL